VQKLKGKGGLLRANLLGKRVDFSARTVITGDPNISITEVGVPREIAMTLTVPITVTDRNRDQCWEMIMRGPNEYVEIFFQFLRFPN
jgi:DNA-directed RNA polymerase beta' subunit